MKSRKRVTAGERAPLKLRYWWATQAALQLGLPVFPSC